MQEPAAPRPLQLDELDSFDPHAPDVPKVASGFIFSLLPKSMDRNPRLDLTILCQMTEAGKQRRRVTKDNPCYYASHAGGYRHSGDDYDIKKPFPEDVGKVISHALAQNGFLLATEKQQPSLLLIYHWGTSALHDTGDSLGTILDRAILVGGDKFARELSAVLLEEAQFFQLTNIDNFESSEPAAMVRSSRDLAMEAMAKAARPGDMVQALVAGPAGTSLSSGEALTAVASQARPLARFKNRDRRTEALVEQTMNGLYYVLISAYDYEAGLKGKRVLLWRARMTVDSNGLSLSGALPSLIVNSAPYLGRDMPGPETLTPRSLKGKDRVDVGELRVMAEPKQRR